ncbi:3-oxoacyl-ACP reductase FabG [Actinomadura terrae]|uniref:3-oxoacyl-ACP reductase FabG n=1 Tax=Actinomadura terrae TaxID=604353 RepID=UPI001FA80C9D|nr:3-oxoacyl-ACP reductase FabG [Actinomadura terrae]
MANASADGAPCALVTGGSRGIGRAIAVQLARDGFDVGFCYRSDVASAADTAAEIESLGRRVHHQAVDVAGFDAVQEFVAAAEEKLGPVTAAVSCAGITRDKSLALMPPEDWSAVLRTNLDGSFNLARAVMFGMIKRRAGTLVLVSSVSGIIGNAGQANYAASKAGMHGLGASLALEVAGRGVRVNTVAPGLIESDMVAAMPARARAKFEADIPMGRFGVPQDVADAVSFLVSDRAAYITGTVLRVDGGLAH